MALECELLKAVFIYTGYVGKDEEKGPAVYEKKLKKDQAVYLFIVGIVELAEPLTAYLLITTYRRALIIWISI